MELKLGSIPLKVQGRFFLMALLLGLNERDPARLALWVAIVFVSVLVHELGHALMGMAFGFKPNIELHGMGGHVTFGGARWDTTTGRSVLISLAGPFMGFLFAAVVAGIQLAGFHPTQPIARVALSHLWWVNVGWGIFNLVPMLPLDGGNVMRSVVRHFAVARGEYIARVVSIITAAAIGIWALKGSQWWMLYLAALFAYQNVQAVRQVVDAKADHSLAGAVDRGFGALNRNDAKEAIRLLEPVLASKEGHPHLRKSGLEVYAVALIKEKRWAEAVKVLERERALLSGDDVKKYAAMFRRADRDAEAERVEALGKSTALDDFRA